MWNDPDYVWILFLKILEEFKGWRFAALVVDNCDCVIVVVGSFENGVNG